MAQITVDVLADLKKLKSSLDEFFKKNFKANIEPSGNGGGGNNNLNQTNKEGFAGVLALGAKILGPLAVLYKILDYFKVFDLIFAFVMTALFGIWDFVKGFAGKLKEAYSNLGSFLSDVFWNVIGWLGEKLSPVIEKIKEWIKPIWDMLVAGWEKLKSVFARTWEILNIVWNKIVEWLKWGWDLIAPILSKVVEKVKQVWEKVIEFWESNIQPILEGVWENIKNVFEWIKKIFTAFFNDPIGTLKKGFQFAVDAIGKLPGLIWGYIQKLPNLIATALKGILNIGKSIGSAASGFFGGSKSKSKSVNDAIITKDGKVIKTNPEDTIFATKNPSIGNQSVTINLYGVTQKEMIDYIRRELGSQINKVGRY